MTTIAILSAEAFDEARYAETTEKLRKNEVASENSRTDWSRETIFALASGALTTDDLLQRLLVALKPRKPNGKAGDSFSSLRYAKGGDAIRKAADTCIKLVEASEKGAIADDFRPIIIAFATDAPDAPKSLRALQEEATRLRREAAKAAAGDNADNDADADNEAEAGNADETPLAVMAARMALAIREASPEARLAADAALTDLLNALTEAADAADDMAEAA